MKKAMLVMAMALMGAMQVSAQNVKVDDKDGTLAEQKVMDTVNACTEALGDSGRVLLRKSGTEPVLRVMSEAGSTEECEKYVDAIIEAMKESGHLIEVKK